jgi:transposase
MDEKKAEEEGKATAPIHRRRRFSAADKKRMLDEAAVPGESVSTIARKYGISPSLMFRWRKLREEGALAGLSADERVVAESELKQLKTQVRELQRLLGKKTQENEILRDAIELAREKKLLSPAALSKLEDIL